MDAEEWQHADNTLIGNHTMECSKTEYGISPKYIVVAVDEVALVLTVYNADRWNQIMTEAGGQLCASNACCDEHKTFRKDQVTVKYMRQDKTSQQTTATDNIFEAKR